MRPPSYYTSLANSNSANRSNSSQQLRSSFSSSSSAAYVTRTHLPFVAQSALVAHCITGAGSTTRPYGQPTSQYSTGSYSTRTPSTRRPGNPYLASQSTSSSYLATRTSLNPSSSSYSRPTISSSNYSRPSTLSTYYKPIRLRERPILTQLARPNYTPSHSIHSNRFEKRESCKVPKESKESEEASWSSDVARNISRNKYLIKFREFDKRPSISPIPPVDQSDLQVGLSSEVQSKEQLSLHAEQLVETATRESMRLIEQSTPVQPPATTIVSENCIETAKSKRVVEKKTIDEDCEKEQSEVGVEKKILEKKKKVPKERRNIRLKIKAVNEKPSERNVTTTQVNTIDEIPEIKKTTESVESSIKSKVKKIVKVAKKISQQEVKQEEKSGTPANSVVARKPLATKQENHLKEEPKELCSPGDGSSKRIKFREYSYDDFNFLSVLGHGGWGFVILAELKEHDACFAVKCIKKITIVEDDDFDSIMIERKVLTLGNVHPFICKLFCTFETPGYLFFVMEYCAGGDLMFHVQREGKFTESRCRFYAAEIICAIRFLHNQHIIYRDLKLDNILLDSKGHIRLVDFGMCQCRTYREEMLPSNFCGTPEYISPEIIKGVPYNHSVDWWSFGVLLYEMAVGKMPFRGSDENELLWNVCYEQIHYPMFLTKELTTLLQLLLEREPTKRMGMSSCKAGDIHDQAWFRGTDWRAFEEMRVEPPFLPQVDSRRDVQNFDDDFTQSTPELSPVSKSTLDKIDQEQFRKFPYTNPNIFNFD